MDFSSSLHLLTISAEKCNITRSLTSTWRKGTAQLIWANARFRSLRGSRPLASARSPCTEHLHLQMCHSGIQVDKSSNMNVTYEIEPAEEERRTFSVFSFLGLFRWILDPVEGGASCWQRQFSVGFLVVAAGGKRRWSAALRARMGRRSCGRAAVETAGWQSKQRLHHRYRIFTAQAELVSLPAWVNQN